MYKLTNLSPTPVASLLRAEKIAKQKGLHFVYVGNLPVSQEENTYCPSCGKVLIKRIGYAVLENKMQTNRCPYCGATVSGVWN